MVADDDYAMLVVPEDPALPPYLYRGNDDAPTVVVPLGTAVSGTVRGPGGNPLANATVQLVDDGVASTTATTAANGTYTVKMSPPSLGTNEFMGEIIVTPPAGSGLPKLEASGTFDRNAVDARYASTLVLRDAGGMAVKRSGAGLANTPVMIVGVITGAGVVSSAGTDVQAEGRLRISSMTNAGGVLPSTLVPAASQLSAVVRPAMSDVAVAALDTTASVPASIDAPMMQSFSLVVERADGAGTAAVNNARVELVPSGALALAGVPSTIVTADGQGVATGTVAAGGTYDARVADPSLAAGPLVIASADAVVLSSLVMLPPPVSVLGTLTLQGEANPLPNTPVELRCRTCTGLDGVRPLAEGVSDAQGKFTLVVADPAPL
jgi:hypothetical protein